MLAGILLRFWFTGVASFGWSVRCGSMLLVYGCSLGRCHFYIRVATADDYWDRHRSRRVGVTITMMLSFRPVLPTYMPLIVLRCSQSGRCTSFSGDVPKARDYLQQ